MFSDAFGVMGQIVATFLSHPSEETKVTVSLVESKPLIILTSGRGLITCRFLHAIYIYILLDRYVSAAPAVNDCVISCDLASSAEHTVLVVLRRRPAGGG